MQAQYKFSEYAENKGRTHQSGFDVKVSPVSTVSELASLVVTFSCYRTRYRCSGVNGRYECLADNVGCSRP